MNKKPFIALAVCTSICVSAAITVIESMFSLASRRKSLLFKGEYKKREKELSKGYPDVVANILKKSEALRNLNLDTITIQSHDGLKLTGYWYPAENAQRTILLVHGWRSAWHLDFGAITPFLHQNGCNLLFIEQRSHGESEGQYISFGVLERFDILSWVTYLKKDMNHELPVYLFGISMGAATVLMASGLPLENQVKGIIADCGYTSADAIIRNVLSKKKRFPIDQALSITDHICEHHAGFKYEDYSTLNAMKSCRIPVLFIHGADDTFVPVEMTYQNYKACAAPKDLLIVRNCDHGMSYAVNPNAYEKRLFSFFTKYDKRPSEFFQKN